MTQEKGTATPKTPPVVGKAKQTKQTKLKDETTKHHDGSTTRVWQTRDLDGTFINHRETTRPDRY
jgi:hypothetical protein